jgi:hypothetical protein
LKNTKLVSSDDRRVAPDSSASKCKLAAMDGRVNPVAIRGLCLHRLHAQIDCESFKQRFEPVTQCPGSLILLDANDRSSCIDLNLDMTAVTQKQHESCWIVSGVADELPCVV